MQESSGQNNDLPSAVPKKIIWQCRRGMLELDVLLKKFLQRGYVQLSQDQQQLFHQFLQESDPDLYAWLMGYDIPKAEYVQMVALIRVSQA